MKTVHNNAKNNLRSLMNWRGLRCPDVVCLILGCRKKDVPDTERRRISRLRSGAVRISLDDVAELAEVLGVDVCKLAFAEEATFLKYLQQTFPKEENE